MGTKYIHLIRHGQYNMDKNHKKCGYLSSLGRYQARRVGGRLNQHNVSVIHVSTMKSAQETGEKHEALICHGNIIRYLVTKALGVDTSKWINFDIFQCSISTVSIEANGKLRLITFGEIGHISPGKRTHI